MSNNLERITFSSLDSLRGIAAILVAWFHYNANWGGYLAVDFFLVLSGFVLSHSYLYSEKVDKLQFIGNRLARLYPLHIYSLIVFTIVYMGINGSNPSYKDGTLFTLIQQFTLTNNVGLNPNGLTWNFPSWSISVEFWVNILFVFFISKTTKNITLILISLCCLFVIYINTGHLCVHTNNYYNFINSGILRGVASFFLGVLAYRAYLYLKSYPQIDKCASMGEIISIIVIAFIVFSREGRTSSIDFLSPFVFTVVVIIFSFERGMLSSILKKFRYLGTISYSIYLNQIAVLMTLQILLPAQLNKIAFILSYTASLLIYSHFTYRFIEHPFRLRCRSLTSKFLS